MSVRSEAIRAINILQTMVEEEYVSHYDIVKMMTPDFIDGLEASIYAYNAENDHWTEVQILTEEEYYGGFSYKGNGMEGD